MISNIKSPNVFGEVIRDIAFTNEGFGCYDNFKLEQSFKEIQSHQSKDAKKIREIISNIEEIDPSLIPVFSNGELTLGWNWDGDGFLVVTDGKRIAYNNDCKNDNDWAYWEE